MGNLVEQLHHVTRPYPAGNAFATRFFLGKIEKILSHINNTRILIHHNKSTGPHDRSDRREGFIIYWKIKEFFRKAPSGWATRLNRLERFLYPSADIKDNLPERGSELYLDESWSSDFSYERECLRAPVALFAVLCVPFGSVAENVRECSQGLHIIDDGRTSVEPRYGRERRPRLGHTPLALD
ncbi:MAG: hypothetical protein A4E63_00910 [Syntrophorhabdus sp. PtaU1.Bin050]|nr:MAG: hypothetical protein A4E63_00910 [Syntrophorhabdus sp. PtaU1.Bin050]